MSTHECRRGGCTNAVVSVAKYPCLMCASCYNEACEIDDSGFVPVDDDFMAELRDGDR